MTPARIIQFPDRGGRGAPVPVGPRVAWKAPGFPPFDLASKMERRVVRDLAREGLEHPKMRDFTLIPLLFDPMPEGVEAIHLVGFVGWSVGFVWLDADDRRWRGALGPFDCYPTHVMVEPFPDAEGAARAVLWNRREGLARPNGTWPGPTLTDPA